MRYRIHPLFLIVMTMLATSACTDEDAIIYNNDPCSKASCDPFRCGDKCDLYLEDMLEFQDLDNDGVPDSRDNCIGVPNPNQADGDDDGIGDDCDFDNGSDLDLKTDSDGDTIPDSKDNCRLTHNTEQEDSDGDGIGDACSEGHFVVQDVDGDTIPDETDNCPLVSNPEQEDADDDGTGDACDTPDDHDTDGDTIPDTKDNCPNVSNPDQKDANHNNIGDVCDADADGDTIPDDIDNCPDVANTDQKDSDINGIGDACDTPAEQDSDGDGIVDSKDNCPSIKNADQADFNHDGRGDACATGTRSDPFVISSPGNCPRTYYYAGDTSKSTSKVIDTYPGWANLSESGPEYFYVIQITKRSNINIYLDAEPEGVDVDIHLLSSVEPVSLVARADASISQIIEPGTYWITADTYVKDGVVKAGKYGMNIVVSPDAAGTKTDPILIGCDSVTVPSVYVDQRSTVNATSTVFSSYPGYEGIDEAGPEYIYKFTVKEKVRFHASLRSPEPSGTDVDLHLLKDLNPTVIERSNLRVWQTIEAGTYYLVADTYGQSKGKYILDVTFRPYALTGPHMFNDYILKAVNYIHTYWAKKGYDSSAYTHDLPYGSTSVAKGPLAPKTMCVAAVAEVILTAMKIYADETGDTSVWEHLPAKSWASQSSKTIKGWIWVNHTFNGRGTGDAMTAFGMGMNVPFKELVPGSFINLNRTTGSGHATVFIAFLDASCNEYQTWNDKVVGFKYYSSQTGGFDYRYASWSDKTMTCGSGKVRDSKVIHNETSQTYLNTGIIYHPKYWMKTSLVQGIAPLAAPEANGEELRFNGAKYNGVIIDD